MFVMMLDWSLISFDLMQFHNKFSYHPPAGVRGLRPRKLMGFRPGGYLVERWVRGMCGPDRVPFRPLRFSNGPFFLLENWFRFRLGYTKEFAQQDNKKTDSWDSAQIPTARPTDRASFQGLWGTRSPPTSLSCPQWSSSREPSLPKP